MSKIKNYTSQTPAAQSIAHIEGLLVQMKANRISKEYSEAGQLEALYFQLKTGPVEWTPFKLAPNMEACYEILFSRYKRPTAKSKEITRAQAERTAWKIISDWVEIQATMV